MAVEFEFKCVGCGEIHRDMPAFGADKPLSYFAVPKEERDQRCVTSSDDCIIDAKQYFVRGCLEIPVRGAEQAFEWGVWVSLSEASFRQWRDCFGQSKRSHIGPFFGWLNSWLKPYPDTVNLKTMAHLRDNGIRPRIELEPTEHPLAMEQRNGISQERLAEIYALMMHEAR